MRMGPNELTKYEMGTMMGLRRRVRTRLDPTCQRQTVFNLGYLVYFIHKFNLVPFIHTFLNVWFCEFKFYNSNEDKVRCRLRRSPNKRKHLVTTWVLGLSSTLLLKVLMSLKKINNDKYIIKKKRSEDNKPNPHYVAEKGGVTYVKLIKIDVFILYWI